MDLDLGDIRNVRGNGVGKNSRSLKDQKRIMDIKIKKALVKEENAKLSRQASKSEKAEGETDGLFGLKNSRRLKNKLQIQRDRDI